MTISEYRRAVRQLACPDCGAGENRNCRKVGIGGLINSEMTYVHDGRSHMHFVNAQSEAFGTENYDQESAPGAP